MCEHFVKFQTILEKIDYSHLSWDVWHSQDTDWVHDAMEPVLIELYDPGIVLLSWHFQNFVCYTLNRMKVK